MSSRRVLRVAEAIREVVSMAILVDLKDPRISDVTVTRVGVSGDLRTARVYVSVMGDGKKQALCMHGLTNSRGYLQRKVGDRVDLRYTPRLEFVLDKGVKHSLTVTRILDEVLDRDDGDRGEPDTGEVFDDDQPSRQTETETDENPESDRLPSNPDDTRSESQR